MICKQTFLLIQKNILLLMLMCGLFCEQSSAQKNKIPAQRDKVPPVKPFYFKDHDSTYYQSFERYITARFFFSQKYAGLELKNVYSHGHFHYAPNTSITAGIGATYQSISLNIGYAFGFLNTDQQKGKTKYLDISSHIYGRKWTIDFLGQFYKGYHITPEGLAAKNAGSYYIRPDLRVHLLGVAAYRILNPSRFSFRAAMLENEKQKKSAGSILVGLELSHGVIKGDSSVVPVVLAASYPDKDVEKFNYIRLGPGIGYAYTFIFKKNFYLSASVTASLNANISNQYSITSNNYKFDVNKGFNYRAAAGYDYNDWNINLSAVGSQMTVSAAAGNKYILSAGNIRLALAKRLKPGRALTKKLHPVDKVIENVKGVEPAKQ